MSLVGPVSAWVARVPLVSHGQLPGVVEFDMEISYIVYGLLHWIVMLS